MSVSSAFVFVKGEARAALKWADGKIIKNEVDMQVGFNDLALCLIIPCVELSVGTAVHFTTV